jgi:hypothetical protein
LTDQLHPMTPHHLPFYIARPGETDWLMIVMGIFLILAVLGVGNIYLRLHSLPERMAHKGQKLQFEIVAVLGLISLFTHIHIFWIAGLLLALVDLPDFSTPLTRIAGSVEKIADNESPPSGPPEEEAAVAHAASAAERTSAVSKPAPDRAAHHHDLLFPSVDDLGSTVLPYRADRARGLGTCRGGEGGFQRAGQEG